MIMEEEEEENEETGIVGNSALELWRVDRLLAVATQHVGAEYYSIPRDGMDGHYRERAYCYELYHQMRLGWPCLGQQGLLINGELDKSHHVLFKEASIRDAKPDFLVHSPGNREGNHTIIEVKKSDSGEAKWCNDIETIAAFMKKRTPEKYLPDYRHGIFLIFGNLFKDGKEVTSDSLPERLKGRLKDHDQKRRKGVDDFNKKLEPHEHDKRQSDPDKVNTWNRNIEIWHHAEPGKPATRIAILADLLE
jgi:hypothetical protein